MTTPFLLLMPSYNQSHYIVDAVRSILAQDDPDWQLWIVDNSTDDTPAVMQQFKDPRIRFHHIPERMDPGSCLNWMLDRAVGRDFSYVHTDNNLQPPYVRLMRAALADKPLGLAYCDMRTIDGNGRYLNIFRRGEFDLPRLLSTDTLGVPFSSTVELAKQIGGFSAHDFADDVRFCVNAFGVGEYVHLDEPLVDYRLHGGSRTVAAGGFSEMQRVFVDLMPRLQPGLEQRGIKTLQLMEKAIRESLDDMDLYVEDYWYRKLSRHAPAWWTGHPRIDHFFWHGLLDLPGFSSKHGRPPRRLFIRKKTDSVLVSPWSLLMMRPAFRRCKRQLRQMAAKPRSMLLTWACMKLGVTPTTPVAVRICSLDARTVWAARELELSLGWQPLLDLPPNLAPKWLHWNMAQGNEPLLDCAADIRLTAANSGKENQQ